MSLHSLFQSYGWQLAIVGLIGTLLVGWLKTPIRYLVEKKSSSEKLDSNFDTVAFILGFALAVILGCTYTAIALKSGWLYDYTAEGEKVLVEASFILYVSNFFGAWLYQTAYYQIWKKLGVKRLFELLVQIAKNALDKDGDGQISFEEASAVIQSLLKTKKLSFNDFMAAVAAVAPAAVDQITEEIEKEVGDDGMVDVEANIDKLVDIFKNLAKYIPQDKLSEIAEELLDKADGTLKGFADNPADVSDSAKLDKEESNTEPKMVYLSDSSEASSTASFDVEIPKASQTTSGPKKPNIKF